MEMLDILRNELKEGISISSYKELSNKYKVTFAYKGMEATAELLKTCAPGADKTVCRKAIDTAISTMYMNAGDLKEAKNWLDGVYWEDVNDTAANIENDEFLLLSQLSNIPVTQAKQVRICTCKNGNVDEVTSLQTLQQLSEINSLLGTVAQHHKVIKIDAANDLLVIYVTDIAK